MQIEKGKISSIQLIFLVAAYIQGSTLTITFTYQITKQDTWLTVLSGLVVSLPSVWAYLTIALKFPGKNLNLIHDLVYGPYFGKLLSIIYVFGFINIAFGNLRSTGDFLLTYIIPQTPLVVVLVMFTFVSAWAVRAGIEVIARLSVIFVVLTNVILILTVLLLLKDMKFTNFLPVFSIPLTDFIQGTHIVAAIPFGEIWVFSMVMPYINKLNQVKSSVFLGLFIGAATLLTVTVRDIAVLGITTSIMVQPSFEAVRLINIANILTRLEIFIAIMLLTTMFVRGTVVYYATVLGTAQLFKLRSYLTLSIPIGIFIVSLGILSFGSEVELAFGASNIWPVFTVLYQFILPALTLTIAKIRGLPGKQRG